MFPWGSGRDRPASRPASGSRAPCFSGMHWEVCASITCSVSCQDTSALCLEGEMHKTHQKSLVPGSSDSSSCFSQIAVGHQQLLGRRSGKKEGCCLLWIPCLRNPQALYRPARNCHILTLQPLAFPCVPFPGQRVVSGSCGRTRGAGNMTSSVRMSRPPRPGRS